MRGISLSSFPLFNARKPGEITFGPLLTALRASRKPPQPAPQSAVIQALVVARDYRPTPTAATAAQVPAEGSLLPANAAQIPAEGSLSLVDATHVPHVHQISVDVPAGEHDLNSPMDDDAPQIRTPDIRNIKAQEKSNIEFRRACEYLSNGPRKVCKCLNCKGLRKVKERTRTIYCNCKSLACHKGHQP